MIEARRRIAALAVLAVLSLALSACLLTPGRFTSSLDLRRDGRFSFAYSGEIHMLALSKLAQDANRPKPFQAQDCYTNGVKRPCTAPELAEQKRLYDESAKAREATRQREAEQMKGFLAGIDPSDPRAAEEFAARLRKQAGWRSVVYKGDGLFVVDYALSGRLDHDLIFPTIERMAWVNAFVQVIRRQDGTVRIDAPGFSGQGGGGNPLMAMMSGMAGAAGAAATGASPSSPPLPQLDGSFTVTTDGTVLANNTEDGPQADPAGQKLTWPVTLRSIAPTALIRLGS